MTLKYQVVTIRNNSMVHSQKLNIIWTNSTSNYPNDIEERNTPGLRLGEGRRIQDWGGLETFINEIILRQMFDGLLYSVHICLWCNFWLCLDLFEPCDFFLFYHSWKNANTNITRSVAIRLDGSKSTTK